MTSYFCISIHRDEEDIFFGFSFRKSHKSSSNCSTSAFLALLVGGINLDYCDTELFPLEMSQDHSVIFETAPKYCILDSFVDYFFFCSETKTNWRLEARQPGDKSCLAVPTGQIPEPTLS